MAQNANVLVRIKRGPKPKPQNEIKVPVKIWVKQKHFNDAKKECDEVERKYSAR